MDDRETRLRTDTDHGTVDVLIQADGSVRVMGARRIESEYAGPTGGKLVVTIESRIHHLDIVLEGDQRSCLAFAPKLALVVTDGGKVFAQDGLEGNWKMRFPLHPLATPDQQ